VLVFTGLLVIAFAIRGDRPAQVRPVAVLSGEWEPFVGSDLDGGGPVASIMEDVLQDAGFDPQLSFESWAAVDRRTAEGSAFGGFPLVMSEDRAERMLVSEPLLEFEYRLFVRSGTDTAPTSASELGSLRVGGVVGYDYWPELDAEVSDITRYDTIEQGFEALLSGDIEVFVEGDLPARAVLSDPSAPFDSADVTTVERADAWSHSTQQLYFMMPKSQENERALEQIDASIRAVKSTPEYREAIAALEPGVTAGERVTLRGELPGTVPLADERGKVVAHTPSGVTARVIEWPDGLNDPGTAEADPLVQLKLGTGPHAGRVLWARLSNIEVRS